MVARLAGISHVISMKKSKVQAQKLLLQKDLGRKPKMIWQDINYSMKDGKIIINQENSVLIVKQDWKKKLLTYIQ